MQAAPAARPKKVESLNASYNKWAGFLDEEEEEEAAAMVGAHKEAAEYEVVEKGVYCMTVPHTKQGKMLNMKMKVRPH